MEQYALIIDYEFCTGCHACEVACRKEHDFPIDEWGIRLTEQGPVKFGGEWMWNFIPIPTNLCDLCMHRIEEGKRPSCVHHCLSACMQAVPVSEVSEALSGLGKSVACFIPQ